jgi:branched-chain amino acid transport system permease protein
VLPGGLFSTRYQSDLAILRTKTQWLWLALGLIVAFAVIPLIATDYWILWCTLLAITIVAVLGLHILSGLCGLFSIGHAAFMAIGAYTVAILTTRYDWNGWLCLPLSALGAGLVGVFLGLPSFRLKMFYLAITTLAGHEIIMWCIGGYEPFFEVTGGFTGLRMGDLTLGGIDLTTRGNLYILAAVAVVLATFVAKNIQRSSSGRAFVAIRDNELAAEVSGIAIFRHKLLAFFIGCAFAGVAGWLFAYSQISVRPTLFTLHDSLWYIGMMIIGGWGTTTGVFLGALFINLLEILNSDYLAPWIADVVPSSWAGQIHVSFSLILVGTLIILFLMFQKRGLYGLWEKFKTYYRLLPYSYRA